MVNAEGGMELYDGKLRKRDAQNKTILADVSTDDYRTILCKATAQWSYMKFPYLKHIGRKKAGIVLAL